MDLADLSAAVGRRGARDEVELDVGPVVRVVGELGLDEGYALHAAQHRQRTCRGGGGLVERER